MKPRTSGNCVAALCLMDGNDAWLCQGDVFASVPVLEIEADDQGALAATLPLAPAVLLTHDCAMDKQNRDGTPRAERLQFARLRSMQSLTTQQSGSLRGARDRVGPFDALWVGDVGTLGECFIYLSDPYFLPSLYFDPICVQYNDTEADGGPSNPRSTPRIRDNRLGRLDESRIHLLRLKMLAFWTRLEPAQPRG